MTRGKGEEKSVFSLPVRVCGKAHSLVNPGLGMHFNDFQVSLNRFASRVSQHILPISSKSGLAAEIFTLCTEKFWGTHTGGGR